MLALLLSRLTAEEERRLKRSVSRSTALVRFCEEAFRHRNQGADWILNYAQCQEGVLSRESARKLSERLLSHVFQVLAASPEAQDRVHDNLDAAHASECVKCGVFIVQTLGNRGVPARWLLNYLDKRADLCRTFGLVEDLVAVHFQRWHMIRQLASPGHTAESDGVYHDLMKATENMRFMMESEQFLFNHLENTSNCFSPGSDQLRAMEMRVTDISLFNHRNRFVFLGFVQLVLQSRIFFARGDFLNGNRLVGEVVAIADEFTEVSYRLRNSPYGMDHSALHSCGASGSRSNPGSGTGVLLRFPRFFGLVHEPVLLELFYRGEYGVASALLQRFLPSAGSEPSSFFPMQWYLIQAFIFFKIGDLRRAAQLIQCMERFPEGRSSWGIGLRLLSIYISTEQGAIDLASHQIESLRKYMERQQRIRPATQREGFVVRLLSGLVRADFDYRAFVARHLDDLDLLASDSAGHAWQRGGYELIPFHEWIRGKG